MRRLSIRRIVKLQKLKCVSPLTEVSIAEIRIPVHQPARNVAAAEMEILS